MIFQARPNPFEDFFKVFGFWDHLLTGFITMIWLYGLALVMGFFLGILLAILRKYGGKIFSQVSTIYIEIVRGTPLLAQTLLLFYLPTFLGLPIMKAELEYSFTLLDKNITLTLFNQAIFIGIITLGLNSAAYQAEYFRGAILSVGEGQIIAAESLGMSRISGIFHVVLPQALRRVIPSWSNEAAYLPKYTVVVYFIGVKELFREAYFIMTHPTISVTPLAIYTVIAIIFLIMISLISKGLDVLHKRTGIPGV
ncbi:MAG: amino acid ABC transporter permease [Candidatus Hermodarchaeota archaeon]